ncbi:glycosyltransferase involved in cell wall biosynthesis [Thiogranum longum]|uniref:Glycosyltransferase involved in cell wall biosynthesis n=2 Tax=Thiogranum longum TaxID=1537524 RepID=A0A4R1HD85_9GAMM|nr:glycosyltransferase involved in cell wall biosynthesis [Thiogranum longum]
MHVLTSLGAGGAETNLLALLREFDHQEFEHVVAFGGEGGVLEPEYIATGVTLLKLSRKPLSLRSLLNKKEIIRLIREMPPDLLHCHLDLANLVGLLAKKDLGIPLLMHFHGFGIVPSRILPGKSHMYKVWNVISMLYRYCDKAIAICRFQYQFLERIHITKKKIVLIPNGISFNDASLNKTEEKDKYNFISVGRFYPQKDHALLIRSFCELIERVPDARLLLVGDGPLRGKVEEQVKALGLQGKVKFLGVRRDIPELLVNSDCFILSSSWELHPITILEAMKAGLPVVSTSVGGVPDTVSDGGTGLLVKVGDQEALTEAMYTLSSDRVKSRSMGVNGRALVEKEFNNKDVCKKLEDVYREMLPSESA